MHLGLGHRDYKYHKVSAALMLIALTLFEVAALLPLSANLFAVLGELSPLKASIPMALRDLLLWIQGEWCDSSCDASEREVSQ